MEANHRPEGSGETATQSLLTGLFLFVVAYFLAGALVGTLVILIPGWREALEGIANGSRTDAMALMVVRWVQGLYHGLWLGLPAFIWAGVYGRPVQVLRLNAPPPAGPAILAAVAMIVSLPFVQALVITPDQVPWDWLKDQGQDTLQTSQYLLSEPTLKGMLANMIFICLLPALFEELFFRGFLQQALGKVVPPFGAIAISAAVFSLLHLQFLVFFPRFVLGLVLGYFFWRTGKMWVNVAAHFTFNLLNVVLAFLTVNGVLPADLFNDDYKFPWMWVGLSSLATAAVLYLFHRSSGESSTNSPSLPS